MPDDEVIPPMLELVDSPHQSKRLDPRLHLIVLHRWGNPVATALKAARSSRYRGNIRFMCNPRKVVSAYSQGDVAVGYCVGRGAT